MSEQQYKWDEQFGELLTRCHGDVKADEGFKANLLARLKQKTAENRLPGAGDTETAADNDANWSRLLTRAYVPCEPRTHFKDMLLSEMQTRQASLYSDAQDEEEIKAILSSYQPVAARQEFKTRLLDNLKERQRVTAVMQKKSRRRTIFMSAISSMAAAAVVFVVWVQPFGASGQPAASPAPAVMASAGVSASSTLRNNNYSEPSFSNVFASAGDIASEASIGNYRVADIFLDSVLPSTMRGIGMEIDHGDGWKTMDETLIARVAPGIALRPNPEAQTPGLGFGDGSTIHMRPDSVIVATDKGFTVRQGTMTVNVPNNSDSRFFLHFAERDLAIEPGTMLAVTVEPEERFAKDGAPAPVVKVLDGGMAVTRGKGGNGILLANQAYSLDHYVTPDIPGRPLCPTECAELEKAMLTQPVPQPNRGSGYSPAQLVSGVESYSAYRPSRDGYSKSGNKWIANSYEQDAPTVRIRYLSDDYFGFANERRDLATVLALGSEVVIDGLDGKFYEIFR